jgi:hypothetical protein
MEPHHRAQLLRSFATLLEQQRKLLGIGDPAPRKYGERADRRPIIQLGPVGIAGEVTDVPREVQPARPLGWEYEDPPGFVRVSGDVMPAVGLVQPSAKPQ